MISSKPKYLILLLTLCIQISISCAQIPDSLINKINLKEADANHLNFSLSNNDSEKLEKEHYWMYFDRDDQNIKHSNFNESNYVVIDETIIKLHNKKGNDEEDDDEENKHKSHLKFNGKSWFKIYFKPNLESINEIYNLKVSFIGACQIYFDGRLLSSYGKIDENGNTIESFHCRTDFIPFYIGDTLIHNFSIRYSNTDYSNYLSTFKERKVGPNAEFLNVENSKQEPLFYNVLYNVTNMLAAFFFALFLAHLLIYLFYRTKSFNLLYSLFLLFLSVTLAEIYVVTLIEDALTFLWIDRIDTIFFPACCFFLVTLLNKLLNIKITKHYKFFVLLFVIVILDVLTINKYSKIFIIMMVFYTYFNTTVHAIIGIKRKIPSSRFLGWGVLSFTICFLLIFLTIFIRVVFGDSQISDSFTLTLMALLIVIAIMSIPLSMTAYLAYDFARTNKSLSQQLEANQHLNEKTLSQEKEKQELLANQNKVLETQVFERTKEIAEQNKILEHQKKEITDSITYAKRIQQALLPELEAIKVNLPNSFILSMPKDIVSGDFYYFTSYGEDGLDHPGRSNQSNDKGVFIAAADCTGHGVPGALMSMIVHEKLEHATRIYSEPKDILTSINKQVKDALKQSQNEGASRDGCDIALLKINETMLSYSGAYRPLYVFDRDGNFSEIKGTKTAIAGLTPYNQVFDQVEIPIKELKAVYIFSDGYADQFGGEKTKKLTTKKFKELLKSVVNLPIDEQQKTLEGFFESWKGNVEQIDDVLVIGITF